MAIPLEWKASITGIDNVKQKLSEIREEYARGGISIEEFGQKQRFLARQAKVVNQTMGQQKSLFLALHPSIGKVSNAMSIFGSVSRSALSIMNALNLATLAAHGFNQQVSDINIEIIKQRREISKLSEAGLGVGDAAFDEAVAKLNELEAALSAVNKQAKDQEFQNIITDIFGITLAVGTVTQTIIKLLPFMNKLKGLGGITGVLGLGGAGGLAGIAAAATGFGLIALGVAFAADEMFKFLFALDDMEAWREQNRQAFIELFTIALPNALSGLHSMWISIWENIKKTTFGVINTLVGGFEKLVNAFIRIINTFIEAYNRVARAIGKSTISKLSSVSLPRLGDEGSSTGEGLSSLKRNKHGAILPNQIGATATGTIVLNVQGSIISERELENLTANALKARLKRSGFG